MTTSQQQVFRQPEIPASIRAQAKELTELLAPYEEFMRSIDQTNQEEKLIANNILREEVLDSEFFSKLDALVESVAAHLAFIGRSGQQFSRMKRQLRRHHEIIYGWVRELFTNGSRLAATFLLDAVQAYELIYIEQAIPNPALRKEQIHLVVKNNERTHEVEAIVRWLVWRDNSHARTRQMKDVVTTFAADVEEYAKDIKPLLDAHFTVHEEWKGSYVTFELNSQLQAILGAWEIAITPLKSNNSLDLFHCHLTLDNGQKISYFVNRTNGEVVPPTLRYVSARYLFSRYDLGHVYDALRKLTLIAIYEAITSGKIVPAYWTNEEQVLDEPEETEVFENKNAPSEPEPELQQAPESSNKTTAMTAEELNDKTVSRKEVVHVARGRVTWSRVLRALKQFGVQVEWNHHPMLVKDGIRVRYANPHDDDARKNARYLHMALRAFKIDRNEFYAILMA